MPRTFINLTTAFVIAIVTVIASPDLASAQNMTMPKSMNEFVNWHLDRGVTGIWVNTGVTKDMWVGIPAGIPFTGTNTMVYSPESDTLYNSQQMTTDDGRVISTGVGLMYWNDELKAPMACSSGFDMGKPYTGTSVLKGMDGDTIHWEYTEISQGKTTTYTNVMEYTGPNTRTQTVTAGKDGEPWVTNSVRANPGGDLLKTTNLVGTWQQESSDGSVSTIRISWIADGHVLKQEGTYISKDGKRMETDLYVMYWDPVNDHIATMYLDGHGTVIHGKVDSITTDGGKVTIVSSHEGSRFNGLTMSTQMTRVVTDTTLTPSFQGMALNGMRHELSWSEKKSVSKRVD